MLRSELEQASSLEGALGFNKRGCAVLRVVGTVPVVGGGSTVAACGGVGLGGAGVADSMMICARGRLDMMGRS